MSIDVDRGVHIDAACVAHVCVCVCVDRGVRAWDVYSYIVYHNGCVGAWVWVRGCVGVVMGVGGG